MLISFLNSHPNIVAKGEALKRINGKNASDILKEIYSNQPFWKKAVGFKIFYYHPLRDNSNNIWNDDSGVWNELIKMENLYVIHLKRRNILRTLVSRKIAGFTNSWSKKDNKTSSRDDTKTIKFTVEELEKGFRETRYWEDQGDRKFGHHLILDIYYEDLVKNPQSEYKKITELLNLRYKKPKTIFKKQNPEKLSKLIVNYKELKAVFEKSEWKSFFDD
jgi:LPS sulfotransferase NodH